MFAGPVMKTSPRSGHSMSSVPPGDVTFARLDARPFTFAATSAAHAPVPHPRVGPAPRSQVRILSESGASTQHQVTFTRSANAGWFWIRRLSGGMTS